MEENLNNLDEPKKGGASKVLLICLVVVIIGGGGYLAYEKFFNKPASTVSTATVNSAQTASLENSNSVSTNQSLSAAASDDQITKDLNSTDSQFKSLDSSTSSADAGLNDKETDLN